MQIAGIAISSVAVILAIVLAIDRFRSRRAAYRQWDGYLTSIDSSLKRLHAFGDVVKRMRLTAITREEEQALAAIEQRLNTEVEALDAQLDIVAEARDFRCHTSSVDVRPFPDIQKPFVDLIEEIETRRNRPTDGSEGIAHEKRLQEVEALLRANVKDLKERNHALVQAVRNLVAHEADLKERLQKAARVIRAHGEADEEGIAARLMRELPGGRPLEEIEKHVARTQEKIESLESNLRQTGPNSEQRREIESRLEWQKQIRRWWLIQRRTQHQEGMLSEIARRSSEMATEEYLERLEKWFRLRSLEDEKSDLEEKVGELSVANRSLTRQMQQTYAEETALSLFEKRLSSLRGIGEESAEFIKRLTNNIERVREEFAQARYLQRKANELERQMEATRQGNRDLSLEVERLKDRLNQTRKEMEQEREEFRATVQLLQAALEKMKNEGEDWRVAPGTS